MWARGKRFMGPHRVVRGMAVSRRSKTGGKMWSQERPGARARTLQGALLARLLMYHCRTPRALPMAEGGYLGGGEVAPVGGRDVVEGWGGRTPPPLHGTQDMLSHHPPDAN